jgi:leader peptidase (prepilin peptidase)/N-methyltransferase
MATFWIVVAGLAGACVGSFLNVVIWRLPRRENLSVPGSHCPRCNQAIRWYDNLPILSWLLLRARCRRCKAPISARYPFVEALTALLFVLAAVQYPAWPDAVAVMLLLAALVAVTFIDIDHRIIPDAITKPGMLLALVLAVVTTLHPGDWVDGLKPGLNKVLHASAGMLTGLLLIWGVRLLGTLVFKKEAMGLGDAKLLGLIGAFTGPMGTLYTLLVACAGGTVVHGLVLLLTRRRAKPIQIEVRGAGGAAKGPTTTVDRAWMSLEPGPKGSGPERAVARLAFVEPGGAALDAGPVKVRLVLPKNRVLMDEDVVWQGEGVLAPASGGRRELVLTGLDAENLEHFEYFAQSHRYLPFGPYLAMGGAATVLYGAWLRHLFTVAWPALFVGAR